MADPAIIAALQKRKEIEERIAKTETRIKGFKAQLSEIAAFISQWEKFSGMAAPDISEGNLSQNETDSGPQGNSSKEDVAKAAREILSASEAALPRGELFKRLVDKGLHIAGKNPEMVLSTMLWRAGKDVGIVRLKSGGYWLDEFVRPEDKDDAGEPAQSGGIRRRIF